MLELQSFLRSTQEATFWRQQSDSTGPSVFTRVREEVDLFAVLPPDDESRVFDGYYLRRCIHPDHPESQPSLLVYHDGVTCQACGYKGDTTAVYQLLHPELSMFEAAGVLLSGQYARTAVDIVPGRRKEARQLDQDAALRMHLALVGNPEALAGIEAFGFTRESIQRYQLGWSQILTPLLPDDNADGANNIEVRDRAGKLQAYQRQWRYAVPVFDGGRLRQIIYRKANPTDLGAKVQLEFGAGTQWLYNGDLLNETDTAILCEGWGDAICWGQAGFPAVSGISGAGQFHPTWKDRLGRIKRLYVVGDPDTAGRKMMAHVQRQLPWARPVFLPEPGLDGRDLWLAGYRRADFGRLLRLADMAAWRPRR